MKQWRLQAKLDRRFKSGHPWVYSNELQGSPKGVEAGEPVILSDAGGAFLAHGYGNSASLIAFRTVSREESEKDAIEPSGVARRLERAWSLRRDLGFENYSFRLCFGEADQLPGLIIDRYKSVSGKSVLVVQGQTAGADRWTRQFEAVLEAWKLHAKYFPQFDAVIIKNDSSSRKWEGLGEEPARILFGLSEKELRQFEIAVRPARSGTDRPTRFVVDLIDGQKTGFFLDQWANTEAVWSRVGAALASHKKIRMLDLCCYVGQWSSQIASALEAQGIEVELTLVDASAAALAQARHNVALNAPKARIETLEGNVLKDLVGLPDHAFDLVISDPPALIKNRKDIPTGTHAYLQLHTQAFRLVKKGGWLVACSCSGLLEEQAFQETLAKAARRNQISPVQWIFRGGQSPDHPVLAEFPEGRYLKAWLARAGAH